MQLGFRCPVKLPDSGLFTVTVKIMPCGILKRIDYRLMAHLIIHPSDHQRIFHPDTGCRIMEACRNRSIEEIHLLRIRMENINRPAVRQVLIHISERIQQELVELLTICPLVIHDGHSSTTLIRTVIRRVRDTQVCFLPIHQNRYVLRFCGVAAHQPVPSKNPDIPRFHKSLCFCRLFRIKIIFLYIFVMHIIEDFRNFRRLKSCLSQIKFTVFQILQQVSQQGIIPRTRDLIEGNVQRLLPDFIDINHRTRYFRIAKFHGNSQSLVPSHDCHIGIDHKRVCKPKLRNGIFNLLVLLIPRFQFLTGIVCGRPEYAHRQHFKLCSFLHPCVLLYSDAHDL